MTYIGENFQPSHLAPDTNHQSTLNLLDIGAEKSNEGGRLPASDQLDKADPESARKAFQVFQDNYCRLQENGITADTIRAIIQVEIDKYGVEDKVQDKAACSRLGKFVLDAHSSVGPAQVQLRNFNDLKKTFPAQLGKYNACDLVNQDVAALFVAAYITKRAMDFEKGNFVMETKVDGKFKNIEIESIKQFWQRGGEDRARALTLSFNPRRGGFTHDFNHDGAAYLRTVRAEMGITTTVIRIIATPRRKD